MPEDPEYAPERYAQCMRLLWLAASMKSFDVVVCLLPTDEANISMCELVADMVPMLQYTRSRDPSPPQVVTYLSTPSPYDFAGIDPAPLVIPRRMAMPSLICEVLHPTAHWSGSLEASEPHDAEASQPGASPTGATPGADAGSSKCEGSISFADRSVSPPTSAERPAQGHVGGERSAPRHSTSGKTAADAFISIKFSPTPKSNRRSRSCAAAANAVIAANRLAAAAGNEPQLQSPPPLQAQRPSPPSQPAPLILPGSSAPSPITQPTQLSPLPRSTPSPTSQPAVPAASPTSPQPNPPQVPPTQPSMAQPSPTPPSSTQPSPTPQPPPL